MPGDFDEALHPRSENGKFGSGSGGGAVKKRGGLFQHQQNKPGIKAFAATSAKIAPTAAPSVSIAPTTTKPPTKATRANVDPHTKLATLPKTDVRTEHTLLQGSTISPADHQELATQKSRVTVSLSPREHQSIKAYTDPNSDNYTKIRHAEITGSADQHGEHAKTIKAVLQREIQHSNPVQLYRGMSVSPEVASKLMSGRHLDLKATSSFSPKSSEAMDFATGFGEGKHGNIPVIISGRLKGVAMPHSPEVESGIPASKLRILKKSVLDHPQHGKVLVLHVDDGS